MGKVTPFVPRATQDASTNLREFVEHVRTTLQPFGRADNKFEANAWRILGLTSKNNKLQYVYFTKLGMEIRGSKGKPATVVSQSLLRQPFLGFAKALIAYMHAMRQTTAIGERLQTLRYFEAALYEVTGIADPSATTPLVLNRACQLMEGRLAHRTAHSRGNQLELMYNLIGDLGIVTTRTTWRNLVPPPHQVRNRVGKEFDDARRRKLPDPTAMEAMAEIFTSSTTDPLEIATSSLFALMLCAPDRAEEALFVPLDCLIPDWNDPDTGEIGTGLRWFPAKGGAPTVKTVIPSMRTIVIRAISQLRELSEPARVVARWYEENPGKLYLPPQLEHFRNKDEVSVFELHQMLFGGIFESTPSERQRTGNWVKENNVPVVRRVGKRRAGRPLRFFAFRDVEETLLAKLPAGFPVLDPKTGMRYSEALCIIRPGEFNTCASNVPFQSLIGAISYGAIASAMKSNGGMKSIFEKRGLKGDDGRYLSITTHMLRHYLNTLVRQKGGLTEKEIADWSGRRDIRQNKVYDHVSDRDRIEHLRQAVGDKSLAVGPIANIDNRILVTRDEFACLKIITAHTTALGYCIHDFAMLPCQLHADCINCNELVCVKGEAFVDENIRKLLCETTVLLQKAKAALDAEEFCANLWVKHQSKILEHVSRLVELLDDPSVPNGAVIQLSGVVPASRLEQAAERRQQATSPVSKSIHSLDDVRALLTNNKSTEETVDAP